MPAVAFGTLKVAGALRAEAMVPVEQAEGLANVLAEAMSGAELATRSDIATVRTELAATKTELKSDIRELELRITIKLGAMMAASIAIVAALVK